MKKLRSFIWSFVNSAGERYILSVGRMPSPRGSQTPRGNATPSSTNGFRTPHYEAPPSDDLETPMRIGGERTQNGGGHESDAVSLAATSPAASHFAGASPFYGGNIDIQGIDLSSPLNYGTPSSLGSIRTPGIRGTPIRSRPDIRTNRYMRQVNVGGSEGVSVFFLFIFLM